MNREIKFRAISAITNDFVYGSLFFADTGMTIIENGGSDMSDFHFVKPETVGQFTGLKDKSGVEIHEGDIVTASHRQNGSIFIGKIEMPKSCWVLSYEHVTGHTRSYRTAQFDTLEVIGNIHQNKNLLEL